MSLILTLTFTIRSLVQNRNAEISPVCAILGGFLAQEILKVISANETPIINFFGYDADEAHGQIMRLEKR